MRWCLLDREHQMRWKSGHSVSGECLSNLIQAMLSFSIIGASRGVVRSSWKNKYTESGLGSSLKCTA